MSFFGKILAHFFQDAAVNRLAGSKAFQDMALKTLDAQKALEKVAHEVASDPRAAKAAVTDGAQSFWLHLKKEIARDFSQQQPTQKKLPGV